MKSMTTTLTAAALLVLATGCSTSDPGDASETPDAMTGNNPFFTESTLPYQLPPFDRIDESHYRPAFERGMAEQIEEIDAIAGASGTADCREHADRDGTIRTVAGSRRVDVLQSVRRGYE